MPIDPNKNPITEVDVRRIFREETEKNKNAGSPIVVRHDHDGSNSPQVSQANIIPLTTVNGTIDMASTGTYYLNMSSIGGSPSSVTFFGGAKHPGITKQHAMIVGNAQLGVNQQFQPQTTKSVQMTGSKVTTIIQGSAFMYINNADLTKNIVGNSQGHIVYLFDDTGTDLIVANIVSYSNSQIKINVITLASGWTISGLWTIT